MNNKKGSAILVIIGVVAVIAVLGVVYSMRVINEHAISLKNLYSTQAFWIAEGGIQKAAWDYDNNQCRGMTNVSSGAACTSCASCGTGLRSYTGSLGSGEYAVTFDPDTKTYISAGTLYRGTGASRKTMSTRRIKLFFGQDFIFGFGIFSDGLLTITNNSLINSFNSSVAPYNAATANSKGNVGTNGGWVNVVEIENNSVIKGSVSTGPGGTVDYKPSKVTITGGITHTNDIYLEPVSVPSSLQTATYLGALSVPATTTLTAGEYRYDSISLGNNGTLNISGNVKLYLTNSTTAFTTGNNTVAINIQNGGSLTIYTDGAVDFGNKATINDNNTDKKPEHLMIFSRFSGNNGVVIDNNNDFYGAVYAPQTNVEISNNAAFYGAAVGEVVNLANNGQVHYDEALATKKAPWQPSEPRDWQEQF